MSLLVDVHAHLDDKKFSDVAAVVERARSAGVKAIICNGLNIGSNRRCLELSEEYDIVRAALGMYPQDGEKLTEAELEKELDFIEKNQNKIIAIGEIGLDYYWTKKEEHKKIEKQRTVFKKLIELGKKIKKPLIIHSRKAEADCVELLETLVGKKGKIIMHCFNGNKRLMERVMDNKWFFSIPTNIIRSKHFQMIVEQCPLNQLLTETDAPYLSPYADKINEPAFVVETIKKIAEIKNISIEETEKNIFMNFQRCFTGP